MSAAELGEAAALMRSRAQSVQDQLDDPGRVYSTFPGARQWMGDAEHVASWHPVVALAVADSIDEALTWFDPDVCTDGERAMHDALLAVARAYLGVSL